MIKITSINQDGKITERGWDNFGCDFYNDLGQKIDVNIDIPEEERQRIREEGKGMVCCDCKGDTTADQAARSYLDRTRYSITTLTKSKNIASLRIQMGMQCNYQCQYCKQATHKKYDPHGDIKDTEELIANFDKFCSTDRNEPINIQLWGGEPLLYWPVLKMLGEFFRKEFKYSRITVLSNGSLWNAEMANWFLDHRIIFAVSHDGPGQLDYRTGDCLEEGSETLRWLQYYAEYSEEPLYFNAVITKGRYDLIGIEKHIRARIGVDNVRVGFEGIVLVEDEAQFDASTMFTDEDYGELREAIADQLLSGKLNDVGMFRSKINNLLTAITAKNHTIEKNCQQKCSMDSPYNVSINLKGDILACHSTPKKIGHIKDYGAATLEEIDFIHWSKRDECKTCPILTLCRGGCLAQDATAFYHSCNNEFHYHMIFFSVVFQLFFGEKILAIDGIERPTREDFTKRYRSIEVDPIVED